MTPIKIGLVETKQAIDLAIAIGEGVELSLANDGKITLGDFPNFLAVFGKLLDGIDGIEDVPLEFAVATPEEIEELKAYINARLDLDDDKIEGFIEDSFKVVLDIFIVWKSYFQKPQKSQDIAPGDEVSPE